MPRCPRFEIAGTDLGTFAAHSASITVVVGDTSGGGGGGGGGGRNNAPVAVDDVFTVTQDTTSNSLAVLANDSDADGNALSVSGIGTANVSSTTLSSSVVAKVLAVSSSAQGIATVGADGKSVLYTPATGFTGVDSFTYTISDGAGGSDTANVTVNVSKLACSALGRQRWRHVAGPAAGRRRRQRQWRRYRLDREPDRRDAQPGDRRDDRQRRADARRPVR